MKWWIPENSKRFSELTAGWQSILTTLAIVVGAGWTLSTFWALGTLNKARAENEVQQLALEQRVLSTELSWSVVSDVATGSLVSIHAKVRNNGKRELSLGSPSLRHAKFERNGDSAMTVVQSEKVDAVVLDDDGPAPMPERTLRAGHDRTIAFLFSVPGPGAYLIEFRSTFGAVDREDEEIDAVEQAIVVVAPPKES